MRTLAIDYGTKRIGLAISDAGGKIANPLEIIPSSTASAEYIRKIIEQEGVERIIVGLPLNMDGSLGPAAESVMKWAGMLESLTKKQVHFVDERLSSFAAEQSLIDRKRAGERITRQGKKHQLDALVAASLLAEFLDGKLPPIKPLALQ